MTEHLTDLDAAVDWLFARVDGPLRIGAPLALGKPHRLLNALYARVEHDPSRPLQLYTALSLNPPKARGNGLEARFMAPFAQRHFGDDFPHLAYADAIARDALPAHVQVEEFYMQSGALLGSRQAQSSYTSLNYTHAADAVAQRAPQVIVQKVAMRPNDRRLSLSCNNDITQDTLDAMTARGLPRPLLIAEIDPQLPYMGGSATVDVSFFDLVITPPPPYPALFGCRGSRWAMPTTPSACTPARWCATAAPCRSASARWPTRSAMRWCCATPTTRATAACCMRWIHSLPATRWCRRSADWIRSRWACTAAARCSTKASAGWCRPG